MLYTWLRYKIVDRQISEGYSFVINDPYNKQMYLEICYDSYKNKWEVNNFILHPSNWIYHGESFVRKEKIDEKLLRELFKTNLIKKLIKDYIFEDNA